MLRTTRHLAAWSAALTVLAATSVAAQVTDTTRADSTRRPMMRGGMGAPRAMAPRAGVRAERAPGAMRFQRPQAGRRFADGAPARAAGMRRAPGRMALLRGITLSTEQEKALRSAQAKHLQVSKPLMLEMTSARADARLARLNGDQKALDAATARMTATRTKLDSLRSSRSPASELRAVLTPDQQKLLDRNLSEMGNRGPRGGLGAGDGMRPRGFRDGARPGRFRDVPPPRRPGAEEPEQR